MPIYEYVVDTGGCPICRNGIELLQRLTDPPLTRCPECDAALHRVISAPQVVAGQTHVLGEKHIAKHGFTQYRRIGKGTYEKTTGKGPDTISGD
ncbi:MAG: zinc ribbon domain-containing protein [Rhodanobacteraceae bacterium]